MVTLCRLCQRRPISPSRAKHRQYVCGPCHNAQPANKAARARYRASAKYRALRRVSNTTHNRRRIYVGKHYHSLAASADLAAAINTHIKERLRAQS